MAALGDRDRNEGGGGKRRKSFKKKGGVSPDERIGYMRIRDITGNLIVKTLGRGAVQVNVGD